MLPRRHRGRGAIPFRSDAPAVVRWLLGHADAANHAWLVVARDIDALLLGRALRGVLLGRAAAQAGALAAREARGAEGRGVAGHVVAVLRAAHRADAARAGR